MPTSQSEKEELFIDLVSPQGDERRTVNWVAEALLTQGWTRKENEPITKKEFTDGEKNS